MKNNKWPIIVLLGLTILSSCSKEYPGDTYNFSNSLPAYVEITSKTAKIVKQGTGFAVSVQLRTAFSEDVTVNYQVTGTPSPITGSILIPRNIVKGTGTVTLPAGIVVAPATSVAAQFKLVSAVRAGENLRIGFKDPSSEVIALTVTL